MTPQTLRILSFIWTLRSASNAIPVIYTNGGCYRLYELLQKVWPNALPYYNGDHVITRIGDEFYDINGEVTDLRPYEPMTDLQMFQADSSGCDVRIEQATPETWMSQAEARVAMNEIYRSHRQ